MQLCLGAEFLFLGPDHFLSQKRIVFRVFWAPKGALDSSFRDQDSSSFPLGKARVEWLSLGDCGSQA